MSLQKAIVDACASTVVVYPQRAISAAVVPYGVLVLQDTTQQNIGADLRRYRATLRLYDEYREYGGNKQLNAKAEAVVNALKGHLVVAGLGTCYGSYISSTDSITRVASVDVWQKTLIFEFLTSK